MNRKRFYQSVLVGGLLILGLSCVVTTKLATGRLTPNESETKEISIPELNRESSAELGNSMIDKTFVLRRKAISIIKPIIHKGVNLDIEFTLTIPPGKLAEEGRDKRGTFYKYPSDIEFVTSRGTAKLQGGLVIPENQESPQQIYWHATDDLTNMLSDPITPFTFEKTFDDQIVAGSFRKELLYNGRSKSTVRFMYREFNNDYIRPAFTQEVTYDLAIGKEIGFKGARFKILEASNTQIKYIVLKSFDR